MTNHVDLTNAELHEPKNIIDAGTSDAGKVLTPSASVAGTSELRKLTEAEITSKVCYLTVAMADISTAGSVYLPCAFAGTVTAVHSVIANAFTTADTTLTVKLNGVAMTDGTITVTQSGSAAGDVDSCSPSAGNTFTAGQYLQVTSDGAGATTTPATLIFTITRA